MEQNDRKEEKEAININKIARSSLTVFDVPQRGVRGGGGVLPQPSQKVKRVHNITRHLTFCVTLSSAILTMNEQPL